MSWDYRVVRHIAPGREEWYGIHEAYYDVGANHPRTITESEMSPRGETLEALAEDLHRMMKAIEKPPLEYADF